eukprot:TRINITY_DN4849_c0_g1_i1.p1 TRINITY_DN4849_c0_g1~~TRINITY_DN4849_c0_g1_i1.p1  ORF type:complete len:175 (+),score=61.89 TRINITY_DN4849_c0_g1_i1:42-527(+)
MAAYTPPKEFLPLEPATFSARVEKLGAIWRACDSNTSPDYTSIAFEYASVLASSDSDTHLSQAAQIFTELADDGYKTRECYYYAGLCLYQMGSFRECRVLLQQCLENDPEFEKASKLLEILEKRVAREGKIGALLLAGLSVASAAAAFFLWRRRSASKSQN